MCDEHVEARAGALRQARGTLSVRDEFDQATDILSCLGLCEVGVIGPNVGQDETDDLIVTSAAGEVAAFASDLSEHFRLLSMDPHLTLLCQVGNAEVVNESAWVQLCGPFAVELSGRRIDNLFPGRQRRLLFAYLALSRLPAVSRETLMEALWGDARPANAGGALSCVDLQDPGSGRHGRAPRACGTVL